MGKLIKGTPITFAVIALCIVCYFLQITTDNQILKDVLFQWNDLYDEWWRVLTPAFFHGSLLHIIFNCVIFYVFGYRIEQRESKSFFIRLILATAIGGNLLQAYLFSVPFLGLSGVGFGLMGYMAVRQYFMSDHYCMDSQVAFKSTLTLILLNLAIGLFLFQFVANGAHVGGLLFGIGFGLGRVLKRKFT